MNPYKFVKETKPADIFKIWNDLTFDSKCHPKAISEQDIAGAIREKFEKTHPGPKTRRIKEAIEIFIFTTLENTRRLLIFTYCMQKQHGEFDVEDAWKHFTELSGMKINMDTFSAVLSHAEAYKAHSSSENTLTILIKGKVMTDVIEEEESLGAFERNGILVEIFSTVLPDIYNQASTWSQALDKFNKHFGCKIETLRFKSCVRPLVLKEIAHALAHSKLKEVHDESAVSRLGESDGSTERTSESTVVDFGNTDTASKIYRPDAYALNGVAKRLEAYGKEFLQLRETSPHDCMLRFLEDVGLKIDEEILRPALTDLLIMFTREPEKVAKLLGECDKEELILHGWHLFGKGEEGGILRKGGF